MRAQSSERIGMAFGAVEVDRRRGLARREREHGHVALVAGGVPVVAAAEADDRAPQLGLAARDLLQ
nr:hypothetical protein [Microbacterium sp.]